MAKLGMPVTGYNGKVLTEQVQNLAAATVLIGEWSDEAVHTNAGRVAKRVSFWLERRPNQLTFWTPTMTLSDEFFRAIQEHRVPVNVGHLVKLARSPRRMDLYAWLSYRTARLPPRRRQPISLRALWPVFGPTINEFFNFKNRIKSDLRAVASVYPHFKATVDGDVLWLRRSPPPVPFSPTSSRIPHPL